MPSFCKKNTGFVSKMTSSGSGNVIATHNDGKGVTTPIEETITELSLFGQVLTYNKEDGSQNVIDLSTIIPQTRDVFSLTAPTDLTAIWRNENENTEAYFHDGVDWVSTHLYSALFFDRGNLSNNDYFSHGNVTCDQNINGLVENSEIKLDSISIGNENIIPGTIRFYSNGVEVDQVIVPAASAIEQLSFVNGVNIPLNQHLGLRWNGAVIRDPIVRVFYRKVS